MYATFDRSVVAGDGRPRPVGQASRSCKARVGRIEAKREGADVGRGAAILQEGGRSVVGRDCNRGFDWLEVLRAERVCPLFVGVPGSRVHVRRMGNSANDFDDIKARFAFILLALSPMSWQLSSPYTISSTPTRPPVIRLKGSA